MKKKTNTKKRKLFEEIEQGILEIKAHQAKKITPRTHTFTKMPKPEISPKLIVDTREKLHMSRAVFALRCKRSAKYTLSKFF